jgi:hypothetical protein
MYVKYLQGLNDLVPRLLSQATLEPAYLMTNAEVEERNTLLTVFPQGQTLMCYFHIKKACKENLVGNTEKELIFKDIGELHSMLTQAEYDTKFGVMFKHWRANSNNFALNFNQQSMIGEFKEWQIY